MAVGLERLGVGLMQHALIPLLSGAGSAASNFLALYGNASYNPGYSCAVDSDDNTIVAGGGAAVIGSSDGWVAKFNSAGTELWSKAIGAGSTSTASTYISVTVDSNDDIIVVCDSTEPGYGGRDIVVLKLDGSDGSITWQRELGSAGHDNPVRVIVDGSDNVFIMAQSNAGAGTIVAKWNSSGALQWQRTLSSAGTDIGYGCICDSSGNVYICGKNGATANGFVAKYNSSGTIQWQRQVQNTTETFGVHVDGSGNVYIVSYRTTGTLYEISKITSTPTLSWTRKITSAISVLPFGNVVSDASGNVYTTFQIRDTTDSHFKSIVAKWNSSGTVQWKNELGDVNNVDQITATDITLDSLDTIVIAGFTEADGAGSYDAYFARLPNDGTGTGTYGDHDYVTCGEAEAAGSVTLAAGSMTDAAGSLTEAAGNLSVSALSFTLEVFEI